MKAYTIKFSFQIMETGSSYPEVSAVKNIVEEKLPKNVDPHKYLRGRIAEELTRAFATATAVDNKDDAAVEEDPLQ